MPSRPSADPSLPLSLVALVALNPQLFPFVVEGRNDFFVLLFAFAGIALLQRERRTLGVLAVSVAAASKLHAGLLLPFVLAYLFWKDNVLPARERAMRLVRATWPGAVVLAATFVPFLAMDFAAFWDDVVAYNAGGAAWSYPVSGMGFSAILRAVGVIAYPQQDFPFAAFQLAAALPLAAWSLRWLHRDPDVATMLAGYSLTLLAFLFFGRYFHGNHLGFILAVASPVAFLRPDLAASLVARVQLRLRPTAPAPAAGPAVMAPVTLTGEDPPAA